MVIAPLVLVSVLVSQDPQQLKVAISDFQAPAGQEALGVMLSGIVGNELERLELFKVTTAEQVRTVLTIERQKQLLGCVDDACGNASATTSMLGVDLLVTGRLTRLASAKGQPSLLTLDLTLMDAASGQRKSSQMIKAGSESEIVNKVPEMVLTLVGKVLEGKRGTLVVQVSETGAAVKVDNTQVGTTPLDGRLEFAAGPHLLRVEKEGFVAAQKQVKVTPSGVTQESITMVPSPDFIQAYEARENRYRIGTWASGGAAVAGVATFVAMQLRASSLYGSETQTGSFLSYRKLLLDGVEVSGDVNNRTKAGELKSQIETSQLIGYVAGGVGLASGIAAVTFTILSDDPGKYRQYRGTTKITAWVVPTGPGLAMGGEF